MEEEVKNKVYECVVEYMKKNKVSCVDAIYQCDWIIENAYEFISELFEIVEPELEIDKN